MSGRVQSEAERQSARFNLLSTGEVAKRLGGKVNRDTVRSWIEDKRLPAVDGRRKGAKRPHYLVDEKDLIAFIERGGKAA